MSNSRPNDRQQVFDSLQVRDFRRARSLCAKLCEADQSDAELRVLLAFASLQAGLVNEALAACNDALALQPANHQALLLTAHILQTLGRSAEAIAKYEEVLQGNPGNAEVLNQLGIIYLNSGQPALGKDYFDRALQAAPEYADAANNLGNAYDALGDLKAAEDSFRAAIQFQPNHALAHFNLGNLLFSRGDYSQAAELFRGAIRHNPGHAAAHINLGVTLRRLGQGAGAAASLREAIRLDSRLEQAWFVLGAVLGDAGDYNEAISCSLRSLALQPANAAAHYNIAQCYKRQGRLDSALQHLEESVKLDAENFEAQKALGIVLQELGRGPEAIGCYHEALRLNPNDDTIPFFLASLEPNRLPETPPTHYVENLFDEVAGDFDQLLVHELGYRTPTLLVNAMRAVWNGAERVAALDLGCGTGLCGPLLKPFTARLEGIDLSSKMLLKARQREVYDSLEQADIVPYLEVRRGHYDWIVAADVFVYVGDLSSIFRAARNALRPEGLFSFSVEAATDDRPYALRDTLRYAHNPAYLRILAAEVDFVELAANPKVLRYNRGLPVDGWLFVFQLKRV